MARDIFIKMDSKQPPMKGGKPQRYTPEFSASAASAGPIVFQPVEGHASKAETRSARFLNYGMGNEETSTGLGRMKPSTIRFAVAETS
jgi:hypothetical protein